MAKRAVTRSLRNLSTYLGSERFAEVLAKKDLKLALKICKRFVSVNGKLNKALVDTTSAIAEVEYLSGKYDALMEEAETAAERLYGKLDPVVREEIETESVTSAEKAGRKVEKAKITERMVSSRIHNKPDYKKAYHKYLRLSEATTLFGGLLNGLEKRLRALEQVSNNERQAMRDKE